MENIYLMLDNLYWQTIYTQTICLQTFNFRHFAPLPVKACGMLGMSLFWFGGISRNKFLVQNSKKPSSRTTLPAQASPTQIRTAQMFNYTPSPTSQSKRKGMTNFISNILQFQIMWSRNSPFALISIGGIRHSKDPRFWVEQPNVNNTSKQSWVSDSNLKVVKK